MSKKGFFLTFEGPEGSGKSTQSILLARFLKRSGCRVLLTREPGGSPLAEAIREITLSPKFDPDIKTELLLYLAARHEHLTSKILPALSRGEIVICDRFSDATVAYQGYGRGLSVEFIQKLDGWVRSGLKPDLTILLDVPVHVGLKRARAKSGPKGGDRLERESTVFHERVRRGYLAIARKEPQRVRIVKLKPTINETFQEILKIVRKKLGR